MALHNLIHIQLKYMVCSLQCLLHFNTANVRIVRKFCKMCHYIDVNQTSKKTIYIRIKPRNRKLSSEWEEESLKHKLQYLRPRKRTTSHVQVRNLSKKIKNTIKLLKSNFRKKGTLASRVSRKKMGNKILSILIFHPRGFKFPQFEENKLLRDATSLSDMLTCISERKCPFPTPPLFISERIGLAKGKNNTTRSFPN